MSTEAGSSGIPRWNGEPADCVRGSVEMSDAPHIALYWGRALVGERVAVVRVMPTPSKAFYILDHRGQGWLKVHMGGGPGQGHHSVMAAAGSWRADRDGALDPRHIDTAIAHHERAMLADPRTASLLQARRAARGANRRRRSDP